MDQTKLAGAESGTEGGSLATFQDPALGVFEELSLGKPRWVIWEQYDQAPGSSYKKNTLNTWKNQN